MNSEFWKGKKVLLTGHTGFKGSWLSLWLKQLGTNVTGFSLKPSTIPNMFEVANVAQGMKSIKGDIRNPKVLKKVMGENLPEIVIHMAAQALVRRSYKDPEETYSTNIMGTVNLLEAVRQTTSVKAVVIVTSDKCYENKEWMRGYVESDMMGGFDPYSSSKGCAELITAAYRNSFFNSINGKKNVSAIATARAGNVIGGGDWAEDRLIPDILRAISLGQPVMIRNPQAIRPWQHVLEPLNGYLILAQQLYEKGFDYAEGWNFGANEEDVKPVQWIVEQLTHQWGGGAKWQLDQSIQPHEANYLKLDCSKAKKELGWHPKWTLSQALEKIILWQRAYQNKSDMQEFTLKQIADYQRL